MLLACQPVSHEVLERTICMLHAGMEVHSDQACAGQLAAILTLEMFPLHSDKLYVQCISSLTGSHSVF